MAFGISDTPLKLAVNFLSNKYQSVVQCLHIAEVLARVPQGSILGPLFFFMYISDLSYGLSSTTKHFADAFLFSAVHDLQSTNKLNNPEKMSQWVYQWKMSFNPDKSKQARENIFSRKTQKEIHPLAILSNMPVVCRSYKKHLGVFLDEKMNFTNHIKEKMS